MSTFWGIVLLPGNPASPPPSPWNLNVTSVALSADYISTTSNSDGEQTTLQVSDERRACTAAAVRAGGRAGGRARGQGGWEG